jgi:hypothetical protein
MKKLQMLIASVALTFLLSVAVFADDGIISTGKASTPPPPPPAAAASQSDAAETGGIIEAGAPTADLVTGIASGLLQGVLTLF